MNVYGRIIGTCVTFLKAYACTFLCMFVVFDRRKYDKRICLLISVVITIGVMILGDAGVFTAVCAIGMLLVSLGYAISRFRKQRGATNEYYGRESKRLISATVLFMLALSILLFFLGSFSDQTQMGTVGIIVSFAFFVIIAVFAGLLYYFEHNRQSQEYDFLLEQARGTEKLLQEQQKAFSLWRTSIHDYKNTMAALRSMAGNGEFALLTEYLNKESESMANADDSIHSGNKTVDTILNMKGLAAKEKHIPFSVKAQMPSECTFSMISFAIILGNLVDNALDASLKEKVPFIDICIEEKGNLLFVKIFNACTVPPKDLATSKSDVRYHGIGIESVRNHVQMLNGEFQLVFRESKAIAEVMIPNLGGGKK